MSKTTTEIEIRISNGRIANVEKMEDDTCCIITVETNQECVGVSNRVIKHRMKHKKCKDTFEMNAECPIDGYVLCRASALSLSDDFLTFGSSNYEQQKFKKLLIKVIRNGINDFWVPIRDPSMQEVYEKLHLKPNFNPVLDLSYYFWQTYAINICHERHSRLGSRTEWIAFLGVLIKKLFETGYEPNEAWNLVCKKYEDPSPINACGFYDLEKTFKMLKSSPEDVYLFEDDFSENTVFLAGGLYNKNSKDSLSCMDGPFGSLYYQYDYTRGWVVIPN